MWTDIAVVALISTFASDLASLFNESSASAILFFRASHHGNSGANIIMQNNGTGQINWMANGNL